MELNYIKGFTFAPFANRGMLSKKDAYKSLDLMVEKTGANMVIFAPSGIQDTAQSEKIRYDTELTMGDGELIDIIRYAKRQGLMVGLKPTANCKDGTWRAHINFFDKEIHGEPTWRAWFESYTEFQLHYAEIAMAERCDLFICGCEMVMAERREEEWRRLIKCIRKIYDGMLTYNADKYQEDNVTWWDALDAISTSAYYPLGSWETEMSRIEDLVEKYQKPFIIAEAGCMSRTSASSMPNNSEIRTPVNIREQSRWYESMFTCISRKPWVKGLVIWNWSYMLYSPKKAEADCGYDIYSKPTEDIVREYFRKL